jgi:RNA polymerase sigma-70 factor, ECF subfamily
VDDAAAIRECSNGDTGAFRFIVARYQREALGHAMAILGNAADAQDAVQEAFVDAYRAMGRFDPERRFYPWFYTLLRNRCLKALRGRRSETVPLDAFEVAAQGPEDGARVREALAVLGPEDREILTLRHWDGLSYDELADRLGIPRGTVMSRLFHARGRLRKKLEGIR